MTQPRFVIGTANKLQFMGVVTAMGNTVWGGGFGAEFFVCDR